MSRVGAERGSGGSGADEAQLSMALQADMRSVFSWNTKQIFMFVQAEYATEDNRRNQVSVWDRIIEHKEDAVLNLPHVRNKYRFIDADADLRGRPFNLTLTWNVMNKVGGTYFDSHTVPDLVLPTEYDTAPRRARRERSCAIVAAEEPSALASRGAQAGWRACWYPRSAAWVRRARRGVPGGLALRDRC